MATSTCRNMLSQHANFENIKLKLRSWKVAFHDKVVLIRPGPSHHHAGDNWNRTWLKCQESWHKPKCQYLKIWEGFGGQSWAIIQGLGSAYSKYWFLYPTGPECPSHVTSQTQVTMLLNFPRSEYSVTSKDLSNHTLHLSGPKKTGYLLNRTWNQVIPPS